MGSANIDVINTQLFDYSTITSRSYVQDGLVAQYDGIDNVGLGEHDATSTIWKDLVGSYDLEVNSSFASWEDGNTLSIFGDSPVYSTYPTCLHVEFVWRDVKGSTTGNYISIGDNKGILAGWYDHAVAGGKTFQSSNTSGAQGKTVWSSRSFCYSPKQYWKNGIQYTALYYPPSGVTLTDLCAHATSDKPMKVRSIRIYNRSLSPAEIKNNSFIDKIRFNLP